MIVKFSQFDTITGPFLINSVDELEFFYSEDVEADENLTPKIFRDISVLF